MDVRAIAIVLLLLPSTALLPLVGAGSGQSSIGAPPVTPADVDPDGNVTVIAVSHPPELDPFNYSDVLVLINNNSALSRQIGEYFANARDIPSENVAYLDVPTRYYIYFEEFDDLVSQVKAYMTDHDLVDKINYIVTTKGFPLKTYIPGTTMNDQEYYAQACVDEELAMLFGPLERYIKNLGWVTNPYAGNRTYFDSTKQSIYLVNRLTGYDWDDIKALVDHVNGSYGNRGKFVLDVDPTKDGQGGYAVGNTWLRNANTILEARDADVLFDDTRWYVTYQEGVMGYASWGSNDANDTDHAKPHNTWVNGSIAETFVSTGGRNFNYPPRYGQSMIADWIAEGVTGIKGYVWEPFLSAIAHPDWLFETYTAGFNLATSFRMSSAMVGWMGVVVGDPKCAPYRDVPDLLLDDSMLLPSNLTPAAGDPLAIRVEVDNLGGRVENATVSLYMDGDLWVRENATFDTFSRTTLDIAIDAPIEVGDHEVVVRLNDGPEPFFETIGIDDENPNNEGRTSFYSRERPVVAVHASPSQVMTLETVRFQIEVLNLPRPITAYYLDFGDGGPRTSMSGNSTFHSYDDDGVYTVKAWVVDEAMVLSLAATVDVRVLNRAPEAHISVEPPDAPTGSPITFNASGSSDVDGFVAEVAWDLGDGNTSSEWVVDHAYTRPGEYVVRLTITDDDGSTHFVSRRVSALNRPPVARFELEGTEIAKGRQATFNASGSLDPDGRVVQYEWDFGDRSGGEVTTSPWVFHSFTKAGEVTVILRVIDDMGRVGSAEANYTVTHQLPVATLELDSDEVPTGTNVVLDASGSYDTDGEVVNFQFLVTLPDGTVEELVVGGTETAYYRPADDGEYWFTLVVTDDDGGQDEMTSALRVLNRRPVVVLDPSTHALEGTVQLAPVTLTLAAEASDPDGTISHLHWRLAEGPDPLWQGQQVTVPFEVEARYALVLEVMDNDGATTSLFLNFTINIGPTAAFNVTRDGLGPEGTDFYPRAMLTFDAGLSTDPGGIVRYQWDFGDGFHQEGPTAQHAYGAAGSYTAILKVTDDHGATDEHELVITIVKRPREDTGLAAGDLALIGVLLVVLVAGIVGLLWWRRERDTGIGGRED